VSTDFRSCPAHSLNKGILAGWKFHPHSHAGSKMSVKGAVERVNNTRVPGGPVSIGNNVPTNLKHIQSFSFSGSLPSTRVYHSCRRLRQIASKRQASLDASGRCPHWRRSWSPALSEGPNMLQQFVQLMSTYRSQVLTSRMYSSQLLRLSHHICHFLFGSSMLFCLSNNLLLYWRPTYPAPLCMFPLVPLWERAQNEFMLVTFAAPSTISLMRLARVLL
jgi:hypothetical protein